MALFRINKFGGQIPKQSKRKIGPFMAQVAKNCFLTSGTLRSLFEPEFIENAYSSAIKTLYRFDDAYWFQWDYITDVVRSQIAGNDKNEPVPFERTYFTVDHIAIKPQITDTSIATSGGGQYPANSYDLGVHASTDAPIATATLPPSNPDVLSTVRYIYTYVRIFNGVESEGPPSPASEEVIITPGDNVNINGFSLTGTYSQESNITHKRIYRVATSDTGGAFQFVAEIKLAISYFADTLLDTELGIPLASLTWDPPPDDLHSIVNMPNGMVAGLSGNRLCFSEPWQPHAWPIDYRMGLAHTGVSLAVFGQSVVITTDGMPYIATGVHPASVSMDKIQIKQANLSKLSTVDMGEYIVYASANGLVALGAGVNNVLTDQYFTQREWRQLNPSSMHGYYYDGMYICFYDNGTKAGFIFDPNHPESGYIELDFYATAGFSSLTNNELYLIINDQIVKWDRGATKKTFQWKSGVVTAPKPVNPGIAQIIADEYPVTFSLYADGDLKHAQNISNGNAFRLPSGYLAKDFEIELSGQGDISEVLIGQSAADLKKA